MILLLPHIYILLTSSSSIATGSVSFGTSKKKPIPSPLLIPVVLRLASLVPEQKFNAGFLQKYLAKPSSKYCVNPHQDPANTRNSTIIAAVGKMLVKPLTEVAGQFQGGISTIEDDQIPFRRGDVIILRAKMSKLQMPWHEVSTVTQGTR
jgi:hypothetical protein